MTADFQNYFTVRLSIKFVNPMLSLAVKVAPFFFDSRYRLGIGRTQRRLRLS